MNVQRRSLWKRPRAAPTIPHGQRVYAIGDVHGSAELLSRLIDRILADEALRLPCSTSLVILGDIIDRGAGSAAIMRSLYQQRASKSLVVLLGNHEAVMIAAYRGDRNALRFWLKFGGDETLRSFGADVSFIPRTDADPVLLDVAMEALHRHVPFELIQWLETLPMSYRVGDYLFVHAGIRPDVGLKRQQAKDMLWIREEFLDSEDDHGVVVVHGHSPTAEVVFRSNRIGVDTGAYKSGILSAVGLEGSTRWLIDTQ